jgi:hypothetical protein
MAKCNVNDPSSLVNNSPAASENDPINDFIATLYPNERLEDLIAKAEALVVIGQFGGIYNCSKAVQFQYLSILNDMLDEVKRGVKQMRLNAEG